MSGTISFPGLSGDQDYGAIIDALVAARRSAHIEPLESWQAEWESKLTTISALDSAMSSFYTTVKQMDRLSEFTVRNATSSDGDILTASAASTAVEGSYSITVAGAVKHRLGSDGKSDGDTTVFGTAGEQLSIRVAGVTDVITLSGDCSLEDIASEINTQTALQNSLVEAAVVHDGSSTNGYRLVLTSSVGGESHTVYIDSNTTDVDFSMAGAGDRIDEAASGTWTGTSSVQSAGQYLGTTNKTFSFSVTSSGDDQVVGTDEITLHWEDGEGNEGTITLDDTYSPGTAEDVFQGVQVLCGAGTVNEGDTFTIDVWHPDLQAGQDEGLAKTEKLVYDGFSDSDTTAVTTTEQSFSYTYNGQQRSITVPAGATLSDLKNLINNDGDNPGSPQAF